VFYRSINGLKIKNTKEFKKFKKKNSKLELIVVKYNSEKISQSKPCNKCLNVIKIFGIKYINYSDKNGDIIREKTLYITNNHKSQSQKYLEQ
jgi:hypothetical protein